MGTSFLALDACGLHFHTRPKIKFKKKTQKNHHATKCSNCCCATSTPTTRRTSWSRWGQLSYGLSLCGRFSQGCHRSHAFRKILLSRTRAIHSGLPGHDFPDVVGICLRQLPTTC